MERFTISLDEKLAREFDRLIRARGYSNRSEAVRDILREQLESSRLAREEAPDCIAALSYVYNHHERDLAARLTARGHVHHDLTVSTMHAHLSHEHCLEAAILRGPTRAVRAFAEAVMAERGVRHGALNLIPADISSGRHRHGPHGDVGHPRHVHSRPKT
ncbi:MAG TPA: nickel-responsive transcriptional regulator NikR [Candidatus Desulfobacillus sp.]|nr:nickel-responsive transcriptional regulator NikR [Candidatus Desulfobacillus sp.]